MKKIKSIVILLLAVVLLGLIVGCESEDLYDKNINILNERYPTDIIIYGQDIAFRKGLTYRKVDTITEATFDTDKPHQIVVICDFDGSVDLTDEDWLIIKSKTLDGYADFYYLGRDKLIFLSELGFWGEDLGLNEGQCFRIRTKYGEKINGTVSFGYDIAVDGIISQSFAGDLVQNFVNALKDRYAI